MLIVETERGFAVRTVAPPSQLRDGADRGSSAESAVREQSAYWALPDFVFEPSHRSVGSGRRELGDAIIVCGHRGLSIQVKSRAGEVTSEDRERRWVDGKARDALRQARGTIRLLTTEPALMRNLRGNAMLIDGASIRWTSVAIIDHPSPPGDLILTDLGPAELVLSRRNWEFLYEQLRSTAAVIDYIDRVAEYEPIALDTEHARYYELAQEDLEATINAARPVREPPPGGRIFSAPALPLAPAGHSDIEAHFVIRQIMEDLAQTRTDTHVTEEQRHLGLVALDSLPVAHREDLGRHLIDLLGAARKVPRPGVAIEFRRIVGLGGVEVILGACSAIAQVAAELVKSRVTLAHFRTGEESDLSSHVTIGVLLTHRKGLRPWDSNIAWTYGPMHLEQSEVDRLSSFWRSARPGIPL